MDIFKEILPAILQNKTDLSISQDDFEKSYNPWLVNKALGNHYDCIMYANQCNMMGHIDKKLQFQYLLNSVRSYKRPFQKWHKMNTNENICLIKEYYPYSNDKAIEALNVLTEAQLLEIRNILHKGGINNDSKSIRSNRSDIS